MPRFNTKNRVSATIALLVVPLACLGLGACGSSSSKSSSTSASTPTTAAAPPTTSATTASTAPTTPATTTPPASTTPASTTPKSNEPAISSPRQFNLIYECMRRNGIHLPPLKKFNSHEELKINTHTPQYQSTLSKCRHEVLG